MRRCSFYIDFDENPEIGGQQAFYFLGDKLPANELRGCRIVDICFNEERQLVLTVETPDDAARPIDP
ncbi:hypothetical protein SAMN05444166_3147 [Singulisphaera sp. GP187]|uniref:hypothetical protein n=1 Tax=Singulisphaera sp. GP187 TaxID=1882752 RepID=UPI000927E5B1|nr:hypothetical protein [Singulisphaera sp. GP187]SIO23476.1 hypothetical protein SAMN05444166_3147 [Singulisphaera sp. GP187]